MVMTETEINDLVLELAVLDYREMDRRGEGEAYLDWLDGKLEDERKAQEYSRLYLVEGRLPRLASA